MADSAPARHNAGLSAQEIRQADRALRRVHEQLRSFLQSLPAQARNASGMARYLDVDRTTCQRLVFMVNRPFAGLSIVEKMPGVRGLRRLLDSASRKGVEPEAIEHLDASIGMLEDCFNALGGNQSVLIRRIASTPATDTAEPGPGNVPEAARRQMFDAAGTLTGRTSEAWVAVYAYFPGKGKDREKMEIARVHGLIGHQASPDAVPLTFHNFTSGKSDKDERPFRSLVGDTPGAGTQAPAAFIPDFSTNPPPVVSTRQPGEYLVQTIDDRSGDGKPVDVMFGTRNVSSHPSTRTPPLEEAWAMINFPTRRMVFDIYLHRDLARACIPALDVHLWRPDFAAHPGDRWQTRFASGPKLELLGGGLNNAATAAYDRQEELSGFLFEQIEQDSASFIGFRCSLDYPIWRTGYCMSFDFGGP